MSICNLGCGMAESVSLLKRHFNDSEVIGVDFSNYFIQEDEKKYSDASFTCFDITKFERHYDVIILSHTLEHIKNPNKLFNNIINLADKYFILIIPFQEEDVIKENFYSFDYNFFPLNIQNYELIHFKEIDKIFLDHENYLDKEQILVVYANKKNLDMNKFSLYELNNNYFTEFKLAKKKCKDLIDKNKNLEFNLIQEQKIYDMLKKKNIHLEGLIKEYKSRKIVRISDKILKSFRTIKSGFEETLNLKKYLSKSISEEKSYSNFEHNYEINEIKPKKIKDIKVAIILDEFSHNCFKYEFNAITIEPSNWLETFETRKPDLFLCESAWSGIDSDLRPWKCQIYSSINFNYENRTVLLSILNYCKKHNIPTIFWNKEDPTHYYDKVCNFIDTALKFDHIFTTAEECIKKYKEDYGHQSVHSLMFGAQPKLFNPIDKQERSKDIIFAGSWYNEHDQRSKEMTEIFDKILSSGYNLKIYDRAYYTHRDDPNRGFPKKYSKYVNPPVSFDQIENVYKESEYALNINTETKSKTMFARRVFELILCNTFVLSNYSKGMLDLWGNNVSFIKKDKKIDLSNSEEKRINNLYNVLKRHTYSVRFKQLLDAINYEYIDEDNSISIYYVANSNSEINHIFKHYESIEYNHKKLVLFLSDQIPNHLIKDTYQKFANNDEISVYFLTDILQEKTVPPAHNKLRQYHGNLKNINELLSNETPYFIFANLQLEPDFVEKGLLHYSYIEKKFGITLGNEFIFKKVNYVNNIIFHKEKFTEVLNSLFKDSPTEFPVYTCKITGKEKNNIN